MFAKNRGLAGIQIGLIGLMASLCVMSAGCVLPAGKVQAGSDGFKIVGQGQPAATIIIGEKATEVEEFAASELQKYIKQISGASLPINKDTEDVQGNLILIGNKENNARIAQIGGKIKISSEYPGKEGFIIRVVGNNLVLAGSDSSGALYSVYDLLETLGCRWFFPRGDWKIIPASKDIFVNRNIKKVEKPDFKNREIWQGRGIDSCDWIAKNRFNYLSIPSWHWNDKVYGRCLADLGKRGIRYGLAHHSFWYWLPIDKYFESHPEYYALIDGKRIPKPRKEYPEALVSDAQYCWSNPDVAKETAKNICEFLDKYPECSVISLWPNDNKFLCQCEKCMALEKGEGTVRIGSYSYINRSRGYLAFANQVAEIAGKRHPDAKIELIGYEASCIFNISGGAKGHPNVRMVYCLYLRDAMRAIDSPASRRNTTTAAAIDTWRECLGNENLIVADYYYGMYDYRDMIFPIFDVISKDFSYFKKTGITGVSVATGNNFSYLLNTYLFSRFAWDADSDLDELLNDFCAKSFGKASAAMKRYLDLLIEASRNIDFSRTNCSYKGNDYKDGYLPEYQNILVLLDTKSVKELRACLDEAKKMAKDNKDVLERIAFVESEFRYAEYYVNIADLSNQGGRFLRDRQYEKAAECYRSALAMLKRAEDDDLIRPDMKRTLPQLEPLTNIKALLSLAESSGKGERGENIAENSLREKAALYVPDIDGGNSRGIGAIVRTLQNKGLCVDFLADFSIENLSKHKYLIFPKLGRIGESQKDKPWVENLRDYVINKGGGVYFQHASCGYAPHGWALGASTVFPEVCKGVKVKTGKKGGIDEDKRMIVSALHPVTAGYKIGDEGRHTYSDHMALIKGEKGEVVVVDRNKDPVVIAGKVGKGRVVFDGTLPYDEKTEADVETIAGMEKDILINSVKWFCENDESVNE